ncbi:NLI interacting factor [Lasiodiplodia theobromae]|uniref:Mitochondrial import inner membrane translocase subunit TIM50 n=1 Tax=Lasiodiplodia theobromae TaxID=45133 RepID=A0A5N5CZU2_9PEZI|nr:Import inner membrane translocase subunit tim- mitochondrial precursor [Lasiodiplodia theobromae]KAB2570908.1 Mitochondrial import inner membrane translocase subunit tim50 [Lasiodiplodia theobromae]KAF4542064.1 Import inner membrane translocase subunit tim- mitochondrial precursor [Lasiodiplodia theobromae]KAF9635501.1 NLI interacting factor [Lasiodiplodia theobromae]
MLSRAAVRLAAARPLLAPLPRAPAAAYVRTYAKDVKHRATKKSNPYESSPNVVRPKPRPVPESSQETAEFNPAASPDKNTAPQSPPAPGKPKSAAEQPSESADFSRSQPEFESPQSTEANTAPGDAPQAQKPLPDLRHGIPSTFAEEFLKSTPSSKEDAPEPKPNVTEDPQYEKTQDEASGGGYGDREGGELPKSAYETSTDRKRNLYANITMVMGGVMLVTSGLYLGREWDSEQEAKQHPDIPSGWSPSAVYARARARLSGALGYYTEPVFPKLLPDVDPAPPYTLVLSLEDLLVHSEWTREHGWRFAKRPGVDFFLRYLCQYYELVIFTSLPLNSADPIIRKLDPFRIVMWPLFREATRYEKGQYDLSYLNRDLSKTIIIDTKAEHVKNQPENAIVLPPWKGEKTDRGLVSLVPFLEYVATMGITDVRTALKSFEGKDIAAEFAIREQKARENFHKQLEEEQSRKPRRSGMGALAGALGMKPTAPQGGLVIGRESAAEGFAKGKMLSDQIREQGLKQYEIMEKEIRENGEKWLKEMAEEEKKAQEETMKSMKSGLFGFFNAKSE